MPIHVFTVVSNYDCGFIYLVLTACNMKKKKETVTMLMTSQNSTITGYKHSALQWKRGYWHKTALQKFKLRSRSLMSNPVVEVAKKKKKRKEDNQTQHGEETLRTRITRQQWATARF